MRRRRFSGLTALCCALAVTLTVALAGCRLPGAAGSEAEPPAGGWPQPEDGRVTTRMCGLLTDADYAEYGHERLPSLPASVDGHDNSVDCPYKSADDMVLSVEPTADFAKYVFAAELKDHKTRLAEKHRPAAMAGGVVGAADESWFDNGTEDAPGPVAHELHLRRGSLLLAVTLGGARGKKEKDPRSVLTALAGLVLRRVPQVGLTDPGTKHKVEYGVIGTGRAKSLEWNDFTDVRDTGLGRNVRVPWLHVVPVGTSPARVPTDPYVRVTMSDPSAKVGCVITVDNVPVAVERPRKGSVDCLGTFPSDDDGGDAPPSAQPAVFGF